MEYIKKLLCNIKNVLLLAVLISLASLASAYIAEYAFGLKPCVLCLYQRYIFMATAVFAGASLLFIKEIRCQLWALKGTGVLFLGNCGVAIFQILVEQKIISPPATCKGVEFTGQNFQDFKNLLKAAGDHVPCDKIQWELFGISFAGYGALVTLGAAILCLCVACHHCRLKK